jgi:hypothetical protein
MKNINYLEKHKSSSTVVIGYNASKHNALKHGVLSQCTVLHWENREDYNALFSSLIKEHKPQGITEEHLVEELAGVIWRKIRLRYAEMASLQSSLEQNINRDSALAKDALLATSSQVKDFNIRQAVLIPQEETQQELVQVKKYLKCCLTAEQTILKTNSYDKGLAALHKDDQYDWQNWLGTTTENDKSGVIYTATPESLMLYIDKSKQYYEKSIYELGNRERVKKQTLGKSFLSERELNKYTKYETHLDKKFEKTLGMFLKLKELRETKLL